MVEGEGLEALNENGGEMEQGELLDAVMERIKTYLLSVDEGKFLEFATSEDLQEIFCLHDSVTEEDSSRLLFYIDKYLEYCAKTNNPGFLNRMWSGANLPSMLGEMVVAATNTSSCTFESAPVSTVLEKYMIQQILALVGFRNGEGQMTTGSSNGNMLAMMAARNEFLDQAKNKGLFDQKHVCGYVSEDAHYSLNKAAHILGIGSANLKKVPVNAVGEMNIAHLRELIIDGMSKGQVPFFVCGTAGTTVRGAYDSIHELLELRKEFKFWLHIDGAWGGAALVSETLRGEFMPRVEEVDSLTWDFHKMLGTALMCNIFLINNRVHTLGRMCSGGDDSYIFHDSAENEVQDLGAVSLQCGRRVDSFKWFLDWKYYGKEGFAKRVEKSLQLCQYAEQVIHRSDSLELVFPRNAFNICFRYCFKGVDEDKLNLRIRELLYKRGDFLVGYAYHQNRPFLRLLLANHELTEQNVDDFFRAVLEIGKDVEANSA